MTQRKATPLAVLVSDIHLTLNPPPARLEEDWLHVQRRSLRWLKEKAGDLPIVCAGDIFDHWRSSPELINFAMDWLPPMWCIPGQHDLPLHNYEDIRKSAYWTLVKAGKIHHLDFSKTLKVGNDQWLTLHPIHWGMQIGPCGEEPKPNHLNVAVVHKYVWIPGKTYPGVKDDSLKHHDWRPKLRDYDVALFGDNHKGFFTNVGKCTVFNHGTFLRRKSDERHYDLGLGMLYTDGSVQLIDHPFAETWLVEELAVSLEQTAPGALELAKELEALGVDSLDFVDTMRRYAQDNLSTDAQKLILMLLDKRNGPSHLSSS